MSSSSENQPLAHSGEVGNAPPTGAYDELSRWRSRLGDWSRWWPVRDILVPFIATRLMLTLVAWLAMTLLHERPDNPGPWELKSDGNTGPVAGHVSAAAHPILNAWGRWDAGWYMQIAKTGYSFFAGQQSSTAFFPLYPILMRALHVFVPGSSDASYILSGMIVANGSLLVGLYLLAKLVQLDFGHRVASRTVLMVLIFPSTLFFSAVYTESLFLATTVASFYCARLNRWWLAGALAGCAALTRSPGVLLGLPLLIEYLAQRKFRVREIRADVIGLGLIPAALALHIMYLSWAFDNPFAIQDAQSAWGRPSGLSWPWAGYIDYFRNPAVHSGGNSLINVLFALAFVGLSTVALVRVRLSYGIFALSCYALVTAWGNLGSVPRYILCAFPIFIVLALAERNWVFRNTYRPIAIGLAAFAMALFACWRWVA